MLPLVQIVSLTLRLLDGCGFHGVLVVIAIGIHVVIFVLNQVCEQMKNVVGPPLVLLHTPTFN